ncbi:MAG: CPBP family intramembrane metalloprotease, partial [Acidobacteria bacterium]|nr:CPBP family intramembrane metalloprotease [Acidobacteriota bacterium]
MDSGRLSARDKRALVLWVLAGIIGAWFAHHYYFRAFPEASVDFRVSRGEALKRARDFMASMGQDISGYQSSIVFDVDENAKTYLERQIGLQKANQLMASQLDIWYWDVRFFKPQQEEEYGVRISPAGSVVGYGHTIKEAQAGASLERADAQARAQNYLSGKLGVDLNGWYFLPEEANSDKRPNRLDWSFTWEKRDFRAVDAPYRLHVELQGADIGGSNEYLKVPEAWKRDFAKLRSGNDTLAAVFTIPYILILAIAVRLGIILTRQGRTTWRGALIVTGVAALLLFLQNLNRWPLWNASYDTNTAYSSFTALKIGSALLISIVTAITILVLPAAEPMYRESQPKQLQLGRVLTLRGLRSNEFFSAAVVGLSFAAAHIGYVVGFYVVATHFGAWAPQELNYEESVNTLFPWISGAAIGLLASTNEEFTFRLFAIPFFHRLTKSKWIAVIVPAFLWGFLHSNYPQEPAYIRGIEIGIIGVIAGLVMLRWGIMATLIWHYTVDASLVGLFLIRSNSLYFRISGAVVAAAALAPLAFSGISYLVRGRFEPDEDLLNEAAPLPEVSAATAQAEVAAVQRQRYDTLAPAMLGVLALCFVVGGILIWKVKPASIGDYLKLTINAREARSSADEILHARNVNPATFIHNTQFVDVTSPLVNEFLRERGGVDFANNIYATEVPGALWRVRYFRDGQPEEYAVILKPDGSLHSIHHTLAESTPGASLSKDEAVALGEKFLRDEKKIPLSQWSLVESKSDKRPKRIDHELTWQLNEALDSKLYVQLPKDQRPYARIELLVMGNEVTNYRTYIKIPDEWSRQREELTISRTMLGIGIPVLFFAGLGGAALIIFLRNLKSADSRAIPWRRLSLWAFWALGGYVAVFAFGNRIPAFLAQYNTAIPFKTFIGTLAIGGVLGGPFYFGFIVVLLGVAWFFARRAFTDEYFPSWTGMPAPYYRDAFFIGIGGAGALIGLQTLIQALAQHWPTPHRAAPASFGSNFDAYVPAGAILGTSLLHSLLYMGFVALAATFVASMLRPTWLKALIFAVATFAAMPSNWGSGADYAK